MIGKHFDFNGTIIRVDLQVGFMRDNKLFECSFVEVDPGDPEYVRRVHSIIGEDLLNKLEEFPF